MGDEVTVQAQASFNHVSKGEIFVMDRQHALALGKYVRIISDLDEKDVDQAPTVKAPVEFGEPELDFVEGDDGDEGGHLPAED